MRYILILLILFVLYVWFTGKYGKGRPAVVDDKSNKVQGDKPVKTAYEIQTEASRNELKGWIMGSKKDSNESKRKFIDAIGKMTPNEIDKYYEFIFEFVVPGVMLDKESGLGKNIKIINTKYQLFG